MALIRVDRRINGKFPVVEKGGWAESREEAVRGLRDRVWCLMERENEEFA